MKKGLRLLDYGRDTGIFASVEGITDLMKKGLRQRYDELHKRTLAIEGITDLMKKGLRRVRYRILYSFAFEGITDLMKKGLRL